MSASAKFLNQVKMVQCDSNLPNPEMSDLSSITNSPIESSSSDNDMFDPITDCLKGENIELMLESIYKVASVV